MTGPLYNRENPAGIRAMRSTPAMRQALEQLGERVKAEAERLSPVVTGRLRGSWYVASVDEGGGIRVRIGNFAPYSSYLEFGTSEITAQHILGRSVDAIDRP